MTNIGYMVWPKLAIAYIKYFFMGKRFFFADSADFKSSKCAISKQYLINLC